MSRTIRKGISQDYPRNPRAKRILKKLCRKACKSTNIQDGGAYKKAYDLAWSWDKDKCYCFPNELKKL